MQASTSGFGSQTALSSYYEWSVPGKPITVYLDLELIEPLKYEVSENPADGEVGGILLGRLDPNRSGYSIFIEDFVPVTPDRLNGSPDFLADDNRRALEGAIAKWKPDLEKRPAVVGYYRGHSRKGLFLDDSDEALIRSHFASPSHVFLLIQSSTEEHCEAGFFFWEQGHIHRESSYRPFPFDLRQLRAESKSGIAPVVFETPSTTDMEAASREPPVLSAAQDLTETGVQRESTGVPGWLWIALVAILLLILGVIAYQSFRTSDASVGKLKPVRPPVVGSKSEVPKSGGSTPEQAPSATESLPATRLEEDQAPGRAEVAKQPRRSFREESRGITYFPENMRAHNFSPPRAQPPARKSAPPQSSSAKETPPSSPVNVPKAAPAPPAASKTVPYPAARGTPGMPTRQPTPSRAALPASSPAKVPSPAGRSGMGSFLHKIYFPFEWTGRRVTWLAQRGYDGAKWIVGR